MQFPGHAPQSGGWFKFIVGTLVWGLACALVISTITTASPANDDVYVFREAPTFRGADHSMFWCSEMPGESHEVIEAKKEICKSSGKTWVGRSNWTPFAHEHQNELEASAQSQTE